MKRVMGWAGRLALVLLVVALTVPFFIPVETTGTKTASEAAAGSGDFTQALGIQVFYERTAYQCPDGVDCDQAPVFFLLHGFGANTFSFREVRQPLSELGEVIAYDRPGFGFTERPTSWAGENPYGSIGQDLILDELLAKFAPDRPVYLVGHSAGGTLAAQYALDNPGRVQGLILISPAILSTGGSPQWLNWIYSIPQLDRLGPLLVSSIASSGMDLLNRSWYDPGLITPEIIKGYRAPLEIAGWERGFWEFNRAPRSFDVRDRLAELDLPVLLITGDSDTVVATSDTVALAELISGSKLSVIERSGHLAQEESPQATMAAIQGSWPLLSR
jgi:pimeloyl-ACP methyl ester carboxylesterase